MKNHLGLKSLGIILFVTLGYSVTQSDLWNEITERQALKQALPIPSWAPLVERSQKAVVVIRTEATVEQQPLEFPGVPGPFRFFMPMPPEKQRGQGSGFIINEDGYIVTNQHVVEGAQKIKVTVGKDPREYSAKVIGADEALDIALIKINDDDSSPTEKNGSTQKNKWPFLPLGDSNVVRLGDWVMALGSPLGLIQSVNVGIVSQKHRGGIRPSGRDLYVELMQLQMPINPGNSGGPVLDTSGRVIAVSESILASGQSIAFGVPINIVKEAITQLRAHGKIIKAYLGVDPTDLTPQYAKALGLSQNAKGAVVVQVMPKTPAEKAGLKPMDVILEINGKPVSDSFNLRQHTAYMGVGKEITLKVYRKGAGKISIRAILETHPDHQNEKRLTTSTPTEEITSIIIDGVTLEVRDTPDQVRSSLNIPKDYPGAEVVMVRKKSTIDIIDLAKGDVIIKVDGTLIRSAKQLKALVDQSGPEQTLLMLTRRGNAVRFVPLTKR